MNKRIFTAEHRKRLSESKKGKNHPMYGKFGNDNPNYGKKRSEEIKKKISENHFDVSGKNNPNYGKKASKETRDKMRKAALNRSIEHKKKLSDAQKGKNNSMFGKKHSTETLQKLRLFRIKSIENKHGQIMPNYNKSAIPIICAEAKKLGIIDLQHAETPGGEFRVNGYFVDGFSKEKNIVIEYNEPFHKNQIERDERRKKEIIKELGCKFIEIKE